MVAECKKALLPCNTSFTNTIILVLEEGLECDTKMKPGHFLSFS